MFMKMHGKNSHFIFFALCCGIINEGFALSMLQNEVTCFVVASLNNPLCNHLPCFIEFHCMEKESRSVVRGLIPLSSHAKNSLHMVVLNLLPGSQPYRGC